MKLVFLGPPGAGKGTQAKIISGMLGIPHISTGDIFRENMKNSTPLGKKAAEYSSKGLLVPDEITNAMVKDRLAKPDCSDGYILDGYPRTINQADYLSSIQKIDKVINFVLEEEEIISRISGRRTCKACGAIYNVNHIKPKQEGVCDSCKGILVQRDDEMPDVVKKRLHVYNEQTEPLIDYYRKKGLLKDIDSLPPVDKITETLKSALMKK
jgi:adenylate kinase